LCFRTGQALRREQNKAMKSFEGSFRNLNCSPSTSILLNFFFPFIDIGCFFPSLKHQYCRTIVLQNKLKLKILKNPLFQKRRWSCDLAPRKSWLPKSTVRFPAKKRWHFPPPSGCLGIPLPLPQSLYGRAGGRVGVRSRHNQNFSDR